MFKTGPEDQTPLHPAEIRVNGVVLTAGVLPSFL
jgi:hypothetical protein